MGGLITWLIARNKITNEIIYLYWTKWKLVQNVACNGTDKTVDQNQSTSVITEIDSGTGEGPGPKKPKTSTPLAKDYIIKILNEGPYLLSISQ